MTEPTTQELIEWLDNEAVVRMYRKDRDMAHAIAERLRAMQWRPMSEAPRDGTMVLCGWTKDEDLAVLGCFDGVWSDESIDPAPYGDYRARWEDPMHWMPLPRLPQPPEGEK